MLPTHPDYPEFSKTFGLTNGEIESIYCKIIADGPDVKKNLACLKELPKYQNGDAKCRFFMRQLFLNISAKSKKFNSKQLQEKLLNCGRLNSQMIVPSHEFMMWLRNLQSQIFAQFDADVESSEDVE